MLILVSVLACKSDKALEPEFANGYAFSNAVGRVLYPFGKFKLHSYEDEKSIKFEVDLEIKNEVDKDGFFIINGQSVVNFYFAQFQADFSKQTIIVKGVGSTKIGSDFEKSKFEEDYIDRLSKVTSYQFSSDGSKLILFLPEEEKKKIIFNVK